MLIYTPPLHLIESASNIKPILPGNQFPTTTKNGMKFKIKTNLYTRILFKYLLCAADSFNFNYSNSYAGLLACTYYCENTEDKVIYTNVAEKLQVGRILALSVAIYANSMYVGMHSVLTGCQSAPYRGWDRGGNLSFSAENLMIPLSSSLETLQFFPSPFFPISSRLRFFPSPFFPISSRFFPSDFSLLPSPFYC